MTELRLHYPDWGARKLKVLLARQGVELPRNTIHRILQRHDLIGPQERGAAATQRFERERPNELWQMDFKGPKGWPQSIGPLSVLDDHSRYLIALAATGSTHAEPVQQQLEEASSGVFGLAADSASSDEKLFRRSAPLDHYFRVR